ncbi:MAG: hypothetical protein A2166_03385 [Omnitrophica WOR_2 bacterium RBG_13_41_10]|nr:MAG: hypothetical protein A2166_03385 [Omnitrophica WOR_2 bacterium RBG_13_41_10]
MKGINLNLNLNSLASNKDKIINALIILVTIYIAVNLFKLQAKNMETLNIQKDIEIKKNEALDKIAESEKKASSYKDFLNKKDLSLAMSTISNIANQYAIRIISIKPERKEELQAYVKHTFSLSINADSYNTIAKFINTLENNPDVYFVDKINIKILSQKEAPDILQADLILSTITFRN